MRNTEDFMMLHDNDDDNDQVVLKSFLPMSSTQFSGFSLIIKYHQKVLCLIQSGQLIQITFKVLETCYFFACS